jgi:hypothetical protein
MKKVSLLAASVAFALTGCGGSDGGSDGAAPTAQTITGFDGYFNQAVVFDDIDNNGVLDIDSDKIFGLTDENGQVEITGDITGALALQTLTPGGIVQTALANHDSSKFAGKYTIDMDHPAQAMAHELVFRAPSSSDVISPITDLVAIEVEKNGGDLEAAEAAVNVALGGTEEAPVALYEDFVEGDAADAELHKTAQILTESKAKNPDTYEDKATQFAEEADQIVDAIVADPAQDVNDKNLKPVIIDNGTGDAFDPVVVTNSKLVVSEDKLDALQELIPDLEQEGTSAAITLDINGLFSDADQTNITVKVDHNVPSASGITISLVGNILTLGAPNYLDAHGEFEITLMADDINSDLEKVGSASAILELEIEAANEAPELNDDEFDTLQEQVSAWQLQEGEIAEYTLNIENLFTDEDGNIVEYRSGAISIDGLTISPKQSDSPIITISGTPTKAYANGGTFNVGVADNEGATAYETFTLPEVKAGTPVETAHPLENKDLFFIETPEDNGVYNYCSSFRFEDGLMYFSDETSIDRTQECAPVDKSSSSAEYTIDDETGVITVTETDYPPMTFEVLNTAGKTGTMQYTVYTEEEAEQEGEPPYIATLEVLENKASAESRINMMSKTNYTERVHQSNIWIESANKYVPFDITIQMENDSTVGDADIIFDAIGYTATCKDLEAIYPNYSRGFTGSEETQCFDDDGVIFDFDYNALLSDNEMYSATLESNDDKSPSLNFNMTFNGDSFEQD